MAISSRTEEQKWYRMLYRQSFDAISLVTSKGSARRWRQDLMESFLNSHWMLPFLQSQGFMHKNKDTKEFVWWSSTYEGLDDYYCQFEIQGSLPRPLPSSYFKYHPTRFWTLAPEFSNERHMPYVVEPENNLLHLSEEELYGKLADYREGQGPSPQRPMTGVLEFNLHSLISADPDRSYVDIFTPARTLEEVDDAHQCSIFLRQALEEYDLLVPDNAREKKRRRSRSLTLESSTSDEESLTAKQ